MSHVLSLRDPLLTHCLHQQASGERQGWQVTETQGDDPLASPKSRRGNLPSHEGHDTAVGPHEWSGTKGWVSDILLAEKAGINLHKVDLSLAQLGSGDCSWTKGLVHLETGLP